MRFLTLQSKDVIDASTGCKIGYVVDIEIDPLCQCIQAIIVERTSAFKFICFFKGPPCIIIPIQQILTIGKDVILVHVDCYQQATKH